MKVTIFRAKLRQLVFTLILSITNLMTTQIASAQDNAKPSKYWLYVGTYTNGESKGIYRLSLDMTTGELTSIGKVTESVNPSFLAIHPGRKYLYAVNEIGNFKGKKSGAVSAFMIDQKTGDLTFMNQQASLGGAPCHLVVDKAGQNVLVANYSGGSVASMPIMKGGMIGDAISFHQHKGTSVNPKRQNAPHGHSINLDAANRFAFAADLGLDKVLIYAFDTKRGKLKPNDPPSVSVPPGSGPRHFAFHPSGKYAYVINEILSTVMAMSYDADKGALKPLQTITTLPQGFDGRSATADIHVHPSGKFLYGSNRGHNSIAIFSINQKTGKLTPVAHEPTQGGVPRNFALDPSGTYLLAENQNDGTIVVFRINKKTGKLKSTGYVAKVPKPVCIRMMPAP